MHKAISQPMSVSMPSLAREVGTIPSLIKWTGSKRSQAAAIANLIPPHNNYVEPFLGGGALLYLCAKPGALASDIYLPLIKLWQLVQAEPETVVADYSSKWLTLRGELRSIGKVAIAREPNVPKFYYLVRDRFNAYGNPLDLNFLARTCVNGIIRFNAKGEFNNSFHLSRSGMDPNRFKKAVLAWHTVVKDVSFVCQDYRAALASATKGDFVYLDPPYAGSKQRYCENLDIEEFFLAINNLNERRVSWVSSFDGRRGDSQYNYSFPKSLYKRKIMISSGNSAVHKVLNGPIQNVQESLYLSY